MAANLSKADAVTPFVTFISMIVLGVVIAEYIVTNKALEVPIILFFFFAGVLVTYFEMRAIIHRRKLQSAYIKNTSLSDDEVEDRLARFVADLFDEDIPFEESSEDENN